MRLLKPGISKIKQVELHKKTGGIIPPVAAREHERALPGVIDAAIAQAGVAWSDIRAIAVTAGPGLAWCLRTGVAQARDLARTHALPLLPTHHLEGHFLVSRLQNPQLVFPFVALVVSGGHTQMILVRAYGQYEILSSSLDDALGEAFDKVALLLGVQAAPNECMGAALERTALSGNARAVAFPVGMLKSSAADFSFSGLKASVRRHVDGLGGKASLTPTDVADAAASFQHAALVQLQRQCKHSLDWVAQRHPACRSLVVCGGVAANAAVRSYLKTTCDALGFQLHALPPRLCMDNAVMIAWAGVERIEAAAAVSAAGTADTNIGSPIDAVDFRDSWPIGPRHSIVRPSRRQLKSSAEAAGKK
jgi:N6-L-threonylcarbamoyladenine synthase